MNNDLNKNKQEILCKRLADNLKSESPMITYKVNCQRINLEFTREERKKLIEVCVNHKVSFLALVDAIINGALNQLNINEEWLYGVLKKNEGGKTLFQNANPIESRRLAYQNASSLNEVLFETEKYFSSRNIYDYIKSHGLETVLFLPCFEDNKMNLYFLSVWMLYAGDEYYLGSDFPADEYVFVSWVLECKLYKIFGYVLGGPEPYRRYFPELGIEAEILPDAGKLFENTPNEATD